MIRSAGASVLIVTGRMRPAGGQLLRQVQRKGWLRLPDRDVDVAVKPAPYLPIYEDLLAPLRRRRFALLELGVWNGHSLEMWRDSFPRATIVGVDLVPPQLDLGRRVHIVRGDQTDAELMRSIRMKHAPRGFDVIIDDASHLGIVSARSLQVLYEEHLRAGGLYCIEDWGTGYLTDWHDGGPLEATVEASGLDDSPSTTPIDVAAPVSMPSHDVGLVGLVKRLIDHTARGTVRYAQPQAIGDALEVEEMSVWDGIVALRKPSA